MKLQNSHLVLVADVSLLALYFFGPVGWKPFVMGMIWGIATMSMFDFIVSRRRFKESERELRASMEKWKVATARRIVGVGD